MSKSFSQRAGYAARSVRVLIRHPVEGLDRVRNRLELSRWGGQDVHYETSPTWEADIHRALGARWPCSEVDDFHRLWGAIDRELGGLRHGHDSDPAVARVAHCIASHIEPETVVETGVARGVSSRAVLEGLSANGRGRLWSIDFPPLLESWHDQVGAAVPDRLRASWTYVRGSSQRRLPRLLAGLGTIDFCILASSLTEPTVAFEIDHTWEHLRPGGVLLVEGANRSHAFERFLQGMGAGLAIVGQSEAKPEVFGIAVKP